ncbi:MAG TPA: Fe-S cluster assembly protein SufD [Verrucomicrobiae bacterium]|jgi:Fe-S cluster assembly protein SufD|nr:Fe-S cluster assembly protein SufD [Verrucomicrobiae bacterium]
MIDALLAAPNGSGSDLAWLQPLRAAALERSRALGFPTIKHEEWRFTNMAPLLQLPLHPARDPAKPVSLEDLKPFTFGLEGPRLVFVDGYFSGALSAKGKVADARIGNLRAEKSPDVEKHLARYVGSKAEYFAALNAALFHDGGFVSVAAGKVVEQPIHLLFIATGQDEGAVVQPRNLIVAGPRSEVKILESYVSLGGAAQVTNAVTELVLGEGARVEHCRYQDENDQTFHIATVQGQQDRDSRWLSHSVAVGGRLARNHINSILNGSGAEGILNGLYMGRGEQTIDHHTVVDHAQPRCESHEYYHGILADKSHGVFNGKIFVRQDAQKTNAKQTNRNLLLSDNAAIDTKPQLEIFADDVKCTHGATIGQLSEEALFYLQARGIGYDNAKRMLIRAFASDMVDRINLEPVRTALEEMLTKRFAAA